MTTRHLTLLAAAIAATASFTAHAQTKPVEPAPQAYQLDPAKRVQPQPATTSEPAPGSSTAVQQQDYATQATTQAGDASVPAPSATYEAYRRESQGGFFLGAQVGRGEVYDGVDQDATQINAGYRWQAGGVTLLGLEVAGGQLDDEDGFPSVDFASIGFNGRFNFGTGNPVFALVRAGYFNADSDAGDADGGYFGLGLGVDFNRHVNMHVTYTNHAYFDNLECDGSSCTYDDLNSADTLMLGVEARF